MSDLKNKAAAALEAQIAKADAGTDPLNEERRKAMEGILPEFLDNDGFALMCISTKGGLVRVSLARAGETPVKDYCTAGVEMLAEMGRALGVNVSGGFVDNSKRQPGCTCAACAKSTLH